MRGHKIPKKISENLTYIPNYLTPKEAKRLYTSVLQKTHWEEKAIMIFGKEVLQPRLVCYQGDSEARYRYSGKTQIPTDWNHDLLVLRKKLAKDFTLDFNSVLLNLYRNCRDSMGSHNDNEPELGDSPYIASLSLGAERIFRIRSTKDKSSRTDLVLPSGSLLIMKPEFQKLFKHEVPKQLKVSEPRINLSFRKIVK